MNIQNEKQNGNMIIALSRALQSIHRESEILFRQNSLTMAQFAALEALLHKGDMTVGELMEAVLSTSGNMTVVIRNLEQHELVRRMENPKDRRSFLISLTDAGRARIEPVYEEHMRLVAVALSALTGGEKETVIAILKKLK